MSTSASARKNRAAEMAAQLAQYSTVPEDAGTVPVPPLPSENSRIRELASVPSTPSVSVVAVDTMPDPPPAVVEPPSSPTTFIAPPPPVARGRQWRTQGVTLYPNDDERVERLADFFKKRKIKFGKRGNLSLLIGAGIGELDRLREANPDSLVAIVKATMAEREDLAR